MNSQMYLETSLFLCIRYGTGILSETLCFRYAHKDTRSNTLLFLNLRGIIDYCLIRQRNYLWLLELSESQDIKGVKYSNGFKYVIKSGAVYSDVIVDDDNDYDYDDNDDLIAISLFLFPG